MKLTRMLCMLTLVLASSPVHTLAADKAVALYAPRANYSPTWPEGKGVFVLHLDTETGKVVSVSVAESTGFAILDRSAIASLKKWRFRPGPKAVKIPFAFTHGHTDPWDSLSRSR
jgi:TonB family C-terminal domain